MHLSPTARRALFTQCPCEKLTGKDIEKSGGSKMPKAKTFAACKSDEERAEYLATHDVLETEEFEEIGFAVPPKRPLKRQLHMRIDDQSIHRLKKVAQRKGMGYQTLARMWLLERLESEELA